MIADLVTYGYVAVGFGAIAVQLVRRFGWRGLAFALPGVVIGAAVVGLRVGVQAMVPLIVAAMGGAFCLAIVVVTRGRLERFVERDVLPEAVRSTTSDDDTHAVQAKAIGLALLLMVPVALVNLDRM